MTINIDVTSAEFSIVLNMQDRDISFPDSCRQSIYVHIYTIHFDGLRKQDIERSVIARLQCTYPTYRYSGQYAKELQYVFLLFNILYSYSRIPY
jgi:hypothetical protein